MTFYIRFIRDIFWLLTVFIGGLGQFGTVSFRTKVHILYICIYCRCVGTKGYINVTIGGGKVPNTNTNPENELPQIRKYHYYICQDESRLSQCYYIPGRKNK